MSDEEIAYKVLEDCTEYAQRHHAHDALEMLRETGFVRLAGKEAEMMQAITAGIVSGEDAEKMLGIPVTLSPGRIEELPAGTAVTWAALGESRCEVGLRNIVTILRGPRSPFDIPEIVEEVRALAVDGEAGRQCVSVCFDDQP